jgi:hypothetical protein
MRRTVSSAGQAESSRGSLQLQPWVYSGLLPGLSLLTQSVAHLCDVLLSTGEEMVTQAGEETAVQRSPTFDRTVAAQLLRVISSRRNARVLHVRPAPSFDPIEPSRISFSLDCLMAISQGLGDFPVWVETIDAADFRRSSFMANPDFLRKTFDVICIGGNDSS